MVSNAEGFRYPLIDHILCIDCGNCEICCPVLAGSAGFGQEAHAYACVNQDAKARMESSSGGVFTLLAENILDRGGAVFGVDFDDEFLTKHRRIDRKDEIHRLRGSKYPQSDTVDTMKEAVELASNGTLVLYSGTPCQIAGLKRLSGHDLESLICVDLACYGVPSPKVWELYLRQLEDSYGGKANYVTFRDKMQGWRTFSTKVCFEGGKIYQRSHQDDPMMRAFLNGLCLRRSCYHCRFKGISRVSDVTLADFWGIHKITGERDDDKGISLLMTHTATGETLWNEIKGRCCYQEVDPNRAAPYNKGILKSACLPGKREMFFARYQEEDLDKLVRELLKG